MQGGGECCGVGGPPGDDAVWADEGGPACWQTVAGLRGVVQAVGAEPDLTAGRLAEATGLSASAVTSVLDRLERAGFIERVRGTEDRRKVHVRSTGRHEAALGAVFAEVAAGFATTAARYTDEQLQAYVAIQGEFNRTALDLTRSINANASD